MAASNSNPGLYYGQIPTAAQWNSHFATKLDYSPGAANAIPYWDASGNLLSAPASGSCTSVANVFTCVNTTTTNLAGGNIGFIPYQSAPNTTLFVAGNTTTTPQFLTSTGTGAASQAPTLTGSTGTGNVVLASTLNSYALLAGSASQTFSVAPATAAAHAVRYDQVSGAGWITPIFSAGNFAASGAITWTVDAGDVGSYEYAQIGKTLIVSFYLSTTTVGGTIAAGDYLKLNLFGFTAAKSTSSVIKVNQGTWVASSLEVRAGETFIRIYNDVTEGGTFTASTNVTYLKGQVVIEIQ